MSLNEIVEVPLAQITISDLNVRETRQNQDIDALAASIKEHGLLQPVVLRGVDGQTFEDIEAYGELKWLEELGTVGPTISRGVR